MSTEQIHEWEIVDGEENRVSAVTVFSTQAYVTRRAKSQCAPGVNRFHVAVGAFHVEADSVQARVRGEGAISSVQYREIPVAAPPQESVARLEEERRRLQQALNALQGEQESIDKRKRFLDSVVSFGDTEMPRELQTQFPQAQSLREMLEFLEGAYKTLLDKERGIALETEERAEALKVIERKIKQSKGSPTASRHVVEIVFECEAAQTLELDVSYLSQGASWSPVYKMDVPLTMDGVDLRMFARISQQTGEDWRAATLSVTNAVPLKGTALPELGSWRLSLSRYQYTRSAALLGAPAEAVVAGGGASEETLEDLADLEVGEAPAAPYRVAETRELPLAFEYTLPRPVDVGSGGDDVLLPLFVRQLVGDFFHYAVPREDGRVYLVCRTAGESELLSGRLNVHFGGRFVGGTELSEKKAGEELLLNLGVDRGVQVSREQTVEKAVETFLGVVDRNSVAKELAYVIKVENLKDEPVHVHVIDAVPVSTTDRVQVKGVELTPKPQEDAWKGREGVSLWRLDVGPKQTRQVHIKFFVKYPKDSYPAGL